MDLIWRYCTILSETNEQNQEKGDDNSSPGQGDSESSIKVGCHQVISGKVNLVIQLNIPERRIVRA